jgi:cysteinyl-tRNA synthetase
MHNGMIEVKEQKMSKSKGLKSDWILRNVLEKYSANVIKFYMLSTHYRSPLEFSAEKLEESKRALEKIINFLRNIRFIIDNAPSAESDQENDTIALHIYSGIKEFKINFRVSMDDDFNSARATGDMFELIKSINTVIQAADFNNNQAIAASLKMAYQVLLDHSKIFGLYLEREMKNPEISISGNMMLDDAEIGQLIGQRNFARKNKDFAKADEIRNKLKIYGIVLDDRKEGTIWKREF